MSAENKKVPMSDNGKEEKINKVTMVTVDDDVHNYFIDLEATTFQVHFLLQTSPYRCAQSPERYLPV